MDDQNSLAPHERVTIAVLQRDRYSPTQRCLDEILAHTAQPFDLLVVLCKVPQKLKKELQERYDGKARFLFQDDFKNQAEMRNIVLAASKTRLAVLMDNDVYVKPQWLEPLVRCQKETGAAMVVPVVLETPHRIHTAGNDLFITYRDGKAHGQKVLRYAKFLRYDRSNLKRASTDYGELHCQLVEVETAVRLKVWDDHYREVSECDSGLTWAKAGCPMWFEPDSVVFYDFPEKITRAEDIAPFIYKWDMKAVRESYDYFDSKWNIDITEFGNWPKYLLFLNNKVGFFSRTWPCQASLALEETLRQIYRWPGKLNPLGYWRRFKARKLGYNAWKKEGV